MGLGKSTISHHFDKRERRKSKAWKACCAPACAECTWTTSFFSLDTACIHSPSMISINSAPNTLHSSSSCPLLCLSSGASLWSHAATCKIKGDVLPYTEEVSLFVFSFLGFLLLLSSKCSTVTQSSHGIWAHHLPVTSTVTAEYQVLVSRYALRMHFDLRYDIMSALVARVSWECEAAATVPVFFCLFVCLVTTITHCNKIESDPIKYFGQRFQVWHF